jgi:hypothetical protein
MEDGMVLDVLPGVLQGIAMYLFSIVVDCVMTRAIDDDSDSGFTFKPAYYGMLGAETLADAEFADGVTLVTNIIEGVKPLLDRPETAALNVGLAMNDCKAKFVLLNTS